MTMSLDGYVTGPQDSGDAPLGIDGFRLFWEVPADGVGTLDAQRLTA